MSDKETSENIPVTTNPIPSSASVNSEHHVDNDESLPNVNTDNEQTTSTQPNLPRFPDDTADLNKDNLDKTSPQTVPLSSEGQTNTGEDQKPPSDTNNKTNESEQEKTLGRWDDASKKHEEKQQETNEPEQEKKLGRWDDALKKHEEKQQETNQISEKNETINDNIDIPPAHPALTPSGNATPVHVARDPTLYASSEFVDTAPVIASPVPPLTRTKPPNDNPEQQQTTTTTTTITDVTKNNEVPLAANNEQQIPEQQQEQQKKTKKVAGCCTLL